MDEDEDVAPSRAIMASVKLARTQQYHYPRSLLSLSTYINEPGFVYALRSYIYSSRHPTSEPPASLDECPSFDGPIKVFHSAIACFYAPSELCGVGGMHQERIRANPYWSGGPRHDTAFISIDDKLPGMRGMLIAQIRLLFSYCDPYLQEEFPCALIRWFVPTSDEPDPITGMWVVEPEEDRGRYPVQVVGVKAIIRGAHLLPCFGSGFLPECFSHVDALDSFESYFVNHFVDNHAHELVVQ